MHTVGKWSGFTQKVNQQIIQKIHEMVSCGITDMSEAKRGLRLHMEQTKQELGAEPEVTNRAFYPTSSDIRNHIFKAKQALELSKLDQENLRLKITQWEKYPLQKFHFRPYKSRIAPDSTDDTTVDEDAYEETFLMVHQQKWQQDLLVKYGNTTTLMDATYRTTKYDLPLFFLAVKTNVGYTIAAEFVI